MPSSPRELRAPSSGRVTAASVSRLRTRLLDQIRTLHRAAPGKTTAADPAVDAAVEPGGALLELAVTDNRTTMISVRREPGRYRLRLHHMFVEASPDIVAALGRYVTRAERDASATLDAFIDQHASRISGPEPPSVRSHERPRPVRTEPRGQHHDLAALYDELNASYFLGQIRARITWAKRKRRGTPARHYKSLRMGSYSVEDQLIRIHPTLDRPGVPRFYVAWIIYHEMLHQKHQIPVVAGRRCFHTPAFLAEERLFDEYERARRFEQQNLHRLLWY